MNKQDILKFLKNKEDEAITKIKNTCDLELKELQDQVIDDMKINSKEIDELAEYLLDELQPIVRKIQTQLVWQNHSRTSNLVGVIEVLKGKGIKRIIEEDLHVTPRTPLDCLSAKQVRMNTIILEYKKIIKNIDSMRGPEATEYLIGLGFKLPEPQYKSVSEPLEQVDKNKLFI